MAIHLCAYLAKEDTELTWDVDATDAEQARRDGDYWQISVHDRIRDSIGEWRLRIRDEEVHIKFCPWCGEDLLDGRELPQGERPAE